MKNHNEEIRQMGAGIRKFAWFPIKTECGKKIWFRYYWTIYSIGTRDNGDLFLWSSSRYRFNPISEKYISLEDATFSKLKS